VPRRSRYHLLLGLLLPASLLAINIARSWPFTVDDAYISYRYARNFARGFGLVYNAGEHVEGYTNFLWTLLLGIAIRLHLDPDIVAKILGSLSVFGSLGIVYLLSRRLRPYTEVPCIATWLMATSVVQSGYAVFGLETAFFVFLILTGIELLFRERDRGAGFPWSGIVFGLAGLTRPEAPMFAGIAMLFLGWRFFQRQNIVRGLLFAGMMLAHALWRHSYYGTWLPNTALAKTGTLAQQLRRGGRYVLGYGEHSWPVLVLTCLGAAIAIIAFVAYLRGKRESEGTSRRIDAMAITALAGASGTYVLLIGGDWMPYFRFLAPFEPFAFVLACFAVRTIAGHLIPALSRLQWQPWARRAVTAACAVVFVTALGAFRVQRLHEAQAFLVDNERLFWDSTAGEVADWLLADAPPGRIAVWDIGYIGYATDYPLLDLFGLVEPTISTLPGGYLRRTRPAYLDRIFAKNPDYFVLVGAKGSCDVMTSAEFRLHRDPRFQSGYRLATMIPHRRRGYWCIFSRKANPASQQTANFFPRQF
jgi:hypothetical protein